MEPRLPRDADPFEDFPPLEDFRAGPLFPREPRPDAVLRDELAPERRVDDPRLPPVLLPRLEPRRRDADLPPDLEPRARLPAELLLPLFPADFLVDDFFLATVSSCRNALLR